MLQYVHRLVASFVCFSIVAVYQSFLHENSGLLRPEMMLRVLTVNQNSEVAHCETKTMT